MKLHDARSKRGRSSRRGQIEQAIRDHQALYFAAFNEAPIGIAHMRPDGSFLRANRHFCDMLGYTHPQLLDLILPELILPDHLRQDDLAKQSLRNGQLRTHKMECAYRRRNGEIVWSNRTLSLQRSADGRSDYFIMLVEDITERKRAEEIWRETQASLARAEIFSRIMVTHFALDGHWLKVPPALCSLLGFTEPELLASTVQNLLAPEDRDLDWGQFARLLHSDLKSLSSTKRFQRKDGPSIWLDVHCTLVTDRHGQPSYFLAYLRDVTDSKLAEEQLREQARLLDLAQDAIAVCNLESIIQFWNQGAQRLYGWTAAEVLGHRYTDLLGNNDLAFQVTRAELLQTRQWTGELRHITKSGQTVIVSSRWTLVQDAAGKPKSLLVINTDITEKKKIETQFLRAQRMECLGSLASGIAHDLNNILAPITMSVPILRTALNRDEFEQVLKRIELSAQRGADIVKQVLVFGRGLDAAKINVQPKHLVKDIAKMIQETFPKHITTDLHIDRNLWTVRGDPTQIHQVLLNLCLNARDAMPQPGHLSIRARNLFLNARSPQAELDLKPGSYVVFEIEDTGVGIAPELLDKIFEPFFTTKSPGQGTGLGLSTALTIAKQHGGRIDVQSSPGHGSLFRLFLPAAPLSRTQPVPAPPAQAPTGCGELILFVEDELNILETSQQVLTGHGYHLLTANDGAEALVLFGKHRAALQLVVSDSDMPLLSGRSFVQELRKIEPALPVILASGLDQEEFRDQLNLLGVRYWLPKPYTPNQLLQTVHDALQASAKSECVVP